MADTVFDKQTVPKGCFFLDLSNTFKKWLVASDTDPVVIETVCSPSHINTVCNVICRLMGMLHDIGHPPFSHLTEGLLTRQEVQKEIVSRLNSEDEGSKYFKRALTNKYGALHEAMGLFSLLEPEIIQAFRDASLPYFKVLGIDDCVFLYDILIYILFPHDSDKAICQFFHSIIESDIGADRLDYVARDGYTTGIGMGKFDTERILSNLIVFNYSDKYSIKYLALPSVKAKSAVEALLIERYKLHCYLYYHHRVIQSDELLRLLLMYIFKLSNLQEEISQGLTIGSYLEFDSSKFSCGKSVEYGICLDDSYVWHSIHNLYALLNPDYPLHANIKNARDEFYSILAKYNLYPDLMMRLIEGIIHRKRVAFSCWKDYQGMTQFERCFSASLNAKLLEMWRVQTKKSNPSKESQSDLNSIADECFFKDESGYKMINDLELYVNSSLSIMHVELNNNLRCKYHIIAAYRKFKAYEVDGHSKPRLKYVTTKDETEYEELNIVSPIVDSLKDTYRFMPHLYLYLIPYNFVDSSNGCEEKRKELIRREPELNDYMDCSNHFKTHIVDLMTGWMNNCINAQRSKFKEESLIPVLR